MSTSETKIGGDSKFSKWWGNQNADQNWGEKSKFLTKIGGGGEKSKCREHFFVVKPKLGGEVKMPTKIGGGGETKMPPKQVDDEVSTIGARPRSCPFWPLTVLAKDKPGRVPTPTRHVGT